MQRFKDLSLVVQLPEGLTAAALLILSAKREKTKSSVPKTNIAALIGGLILAGTVSSTTEVCGSEINNNLVRLYQSNECRGCNLSRADLANSDFSNADLQGANLSDTNLSGSKLDGANLSGADLSRANLSHSSLVSAKLTGAKMYMADLRNALVQGAELNLEQLNKANTLNAIGIESTFREMSQFMAAAQAAINDKRYQLAESLFTHILESDRNMYKAWIGRSASRLAMGRIDLAIDDLDKSREIAIEQGLEREAIEASLAKEKLIAFGETNYTHKNNDSDVVQHSGNQSKNFAANVASGIASATKIALPIMLKILTSGAL